MTRHSFIQMSKLTNLKGRINYISSHARQENLYAAYDTIERKFWSELAKCNQEEFEKSGTGGKCIEARELIIALPESFVDYEPDMLLKLFVEHFKRNYEVECAGALHHNKRKTNYHIHLIFSERRLLEEPIEKVASRNMFYDENGKRVRTKKEIMDEIGQVRKGCRIIPKGSVYERKIFTTKDSKFKNEAFLNKIKCSYTELMNIYVKDKKEKLQVFDKSSPYLAMKKIGKNNPKAEQIESDNGVRERWNQTVDRALVGGIAEEKIMGIKQTEIVDKAKSSIQKQGRQPQLFMAIVQLAIVALQILISQIFKQINWECDDIKRTLPPIIENGEAENMQIIDNKKASETEQPLPAPPVKPALAEQYPNLNAIYRKLDNQNHAIYLKEQELAEVKKKLENTKGLFKGKRRKELQNNINELVPLVNTMRQQLSGIVQDYGYKNVKEFLAKYAAAQTAYGEYQRAVKDWKNSVECRENPVSVLAKLERNKQKIKERDIKSKRTHSRFRDRDAR
ncbi:MobA/MobL family protein [Ruminococcus sp. OA3]|uniref:MobA/MobL family protein n=1 Tax=Ruminococcus sp. OA3 TaxID=2914164 RepID=UPI0031F5A827